MPIRNSKEAVCDHCKSSIGDGDGMVDYSDYGFVFCITCFKEMTARQLGELLAGGKMYKRFGKFSQSEGFVGHE